MSFRAVVMCIRDAFESIVNGSVSFMFVVSIRVSFELVLFVPVFVCD